MCHTLLPQLTLNTWNIRPLAVVAAITDDWLAEICANKDGKGDNTGSIPPLAVHTYSNYFFGALGREKVRQETFCEAFQRRCEHTAFLL